MPRRRKPPRRWIRALPALAAIGISAAGATAADRLAWETRGSGSPTIVLIHAIGGDRSDWDRVAPRLAAHRRVLLVDLPGHGRSPAPKTPTVAEAARLLERVLADRRVERAMLVGHSFGALVALEAAAAHPARAAAVVAVDVGTYTPADSAQIASVDAILRERYPIFLQAIFRPMSRDPVIADTLIERASRVPREVLSGYFRAAWHSDLRPRIRGMKTPVHLVATDAIWPPAESWTSARRRLGYETAGQAVGHRISNAAHFVAFDQPDSLAAVLERIADGLGR
jgi:pimeloyl-ACP methyl ester carboxylesterase